MDAKQPALDEQPPAAAASRLIRRALKATLATLHQTTGHPYASLVTIATDPAGSPILLLSDLAVHTKNLAADDRVSVLCEAPAGSTDDPLTAGRVTVVGRAHRNDEPGLRKRFLARHPYAEMYASFSDFGFWNVAIENAHYIGGFGRIVDLKPTDLEVDVGAAAALLTAEHEIVSHMNEDHSDAVSLYATVLCGAPAGDWRMTGIDPAGFDIVCNDAAERLLFQQPVSDAEGARAELVRLVKEARAKAQS